MEEGNESERLMCNMIIKICVTNDSNAKQHFKRSIELSKSNKNFITIGLAFLKTVYLAHT